MTYTTEQLITTNQTNVRALEGLTSRVYTGFEKLSELNRAAFKAMVAESFSHTQALLAAKNPLQLLVLQVGLVRPLSEKCAAYGRHVYTVAVEAGGEFTKAFDAKLAESKTTMTEAVDNLMKNAPPGAESAVAAFKGAVNASQNLIESA